MDTYMKKVSVLICTYNRAAYLPQTIDSVLAQNFNDYELLIIDDASTDSTKEVVEKYSDERIRYIRNAENLGLGGNRARSLKGATGEYIAILDSDDYWNDTSKLSKQVAFLDAHHDVAIVGTMGTIVDDESKVVGKLTYKKIDEDIRGRILSYQQFLHSSVLYRKSAALEVGGYVPELAPAEDYDLILKIGTRHKLANLPEYSTCYRIHAGNTSSTERGKKIRHAKLHLHIIQTSGKKYPNRLWAFIKAYLRILKSYLNF